MRILRSAAAGASTRRSSRMESPVSVGPYVAGTLKTPTLTIAAPMRDDGNVVVGINIHLRTISRLLDASQIRHACPCLHYQR